MWANWYKSELRIIQDDNSPMEIKKAVISILEGYPVQLISVMPVH